VDQVAVDVQHRGAVRVGADNVRIPEFVVERFQHGLSRFLQQSAQADSNDYAIFAAMRKVANLHDYFNGWGRGRISFFEISSFTKKKSLRFKIAGFLT
jgi:hypothetical protein